MKTEIKKSQSSHKELLGIGATKIKKSQSSYKELLGLGASGATIVVAMESQPAQADGLADLSTTVTTAGTIVTGLTTTAAVVVGFILVAKYIMSLMKTT